VSIIKWSPEFSLGVAKIDADHRELIDLINKLQGYLKLGEKQTVAVNLFGELYSRVAKHFAYEEAIMRSRHYDHYEEHQADHQNLLDEITTIMSDWESNALMNKEATTKRLYDWFCQHFQTHDARLHNLVGIMD
jgi:hemerythrin-like metal-binding protein